MLTLAEQAERVKEADRIADQEEAAAAMKRQLSRWHREGLIGPAWAVTLDTEAGKCLAAFHVTGEDDAHAPMEWRLFHAYAEGFNARRTAIMNRRPRPPRKKTNKKASDRV